MNQIKQACIMNHASSHVISSQIKSDQIVYIFMSCAAVPGYLDQKYKPDPKRLL